jgi:hypothetical protein
MQRSIPGRVKNNFDDYQRFLSGPKFVEHSRIKMDQGQPKKNFFGKTAVIYAPIQGDKLFEAEISNHDKSHYHFRLFAYWFDDGPVFRFDSKGRPHCNPEDGQGLAKRQVIAPHFHRFYKEKGVEIAYRTPKLGVESDSIVGDYTLGFAHFCQEACLGCNPTGQPVLEILQDVLALSSEDDPQNGVSF